MVEWMSGGSGDEGVGWKMGRRGEVRFAEQVDMVGIRAIQSWNSWISIFNSTGNKGREYRISCAYTEETGAYAVMMMT